MPVIKVIDHDMATALKECRRMFNEVKREKSKYIFYLRPSLRKREKIKQAIVKRKYY